MINVCKLSENVEELNGVIECYMNNIDLIKDVIGVGNVPHLECFTCTRNCPCGGGICGLKMFQFLPNTIYIQRHGGIPFGLDTVAVLNDIKTPNGPIFTDLERKVLSTAKLYLMAN